VITDAMVERACKNMWPESWDTYGETHDYKRAMRIFMRRSIEAAIGEMVLVPRYLTDEMRDAMHEAGYSYDEKW
jgi:hypothetical protein